MKGKVNRTPLNKYFSTETVEKLKKIYSIRFVEQLLSIVNQKNINLKGVAESIGMKDSDFYAIIQKVNSEVKISKHSGRKYPCGAL
ncbi:TPA: hypothetical protein DDY55_05640 [Candidatus Falkowbacteria bacterium]|nr:hypothetical protein [Candidatus Falkowbacteria bacterium]HAY11990.1 hypothetical protein [Candidatus Falkowbacteria bacterium]HBI97559.1 hypothetical protein [Candidatus Falkowbacteria bacterium]HBT27811.1 hypothetical protein [Candidatus Falkowbacteria bacterium]HBY15385.1 hypothetical protein [Candidatus Falkowbacteria bacterium]